MIHSPNRFALTCAGPFHKINAGYEATTTTVNCSCLMYGYYFDAILLNKHVIKAQRYACTHARICAYNIIAAFIRVAAYIIAAFIREPTKNMWNKCKNHSIE